MTDDEWSKLTADFDFVRWTITCRMMMSRIAQGQMEGAHQALRYFCRQPRRVLTTLESHVALAFPVRVANALESAGYCDVDSVRLASDDELVSIPDVNQDTVRRIRATIAEVLAGTHFEVYCDDDEKLVDEELCVRSPMADRRFVASPTIPELVTQVERNCNGEVRENMTNEEQVMNALDLLISSPDTASEAIDKQIAQCEKHIDKYKADIAHLRKIQRNFGLSESKRPRSGKAGGSGNRTGADWGATIEKIRLYVKTNGGAKPGTIAKNCELTPIQVGMAVKKTDLLKKDIVTGFVVLA